MDNRLPSAVGAPHDRLGHGPIVPTPHPQALEGRNIVSRPYRAQMVFHLVLGRCPRLS
jgi:hypothetical protein